MRSVALEHCIAADQELQQQVTWWPAVSSLTTCDGELDTWTGEWQSNKGDYTILVIVIVITINIVIVIDISIKQQSKKQLNNSLTPPQIHHDHHLRQTHTEHTQSLGLDVLSFQRFLAG